MHSDELKPCPFCGSENICHSAWDIQCYGCNASIPGDPNISADAWNRRAALSAALSEQTLPVRVKPLEWESARRLLTRWDEFQASKGNMEEAYYKLAKYAHADWEALRSDVQSHTQVEKLWCESCGEAEQKAAHGDCIKRNIALAAENAAAIRNMGDRT